MNTLKRFFSQAWLYQKAYSVEFNLLAFATWDVAAQLVNMFFYIIVASFSFGTVDLTRWVVGNAFLICIIKCLFEVSMTFTSERTSGRLRSIIVSPTNEISIVFQRAFFSILWGFISIALGFTVGAFVFGVNFNNFNILAFVLSLLTAAFACTGLGVLVSAFGLLSDSMNLIQNTVTYSVMLLSGANFPISQLPIPIQWLANISPLNHSISAANLCFTGEINNEYWSFLMIEVCIGIAYYIAASIILKLVAKVAVKNASLEVF